MEQVAKDQVVAEEKKASCAVDEKNAADAAFTANEIKADCQKDLDEALPEYYAAIKSLDALDKKDIQEIKSFAKPPALVEVVLSAVCLLMGKKENWDESKKMMNDSEFLPKLKNYDKEALANNTKLLGKLQKYIKRDDFTAEKVKSVSNAAMSLCLWVKAMDVYSRVAREIEPKKEKLKGAEASLAEADGKLAVARAELKEVMDKVAMLESQLATAKAKSEQLVRDADECVVKLDRAEKLLLGLGNESVRWMAASEILEKSLKFIIGNIMLAGGFIAYIGPFTAEYRKQMVDVWIHKSAEIELNADPSWSCADVLVDPAEVRTWNIHGLPADDLSIENGIMVTRGRRWPLMIDPQAQANRWVRNMGAERKVGIIKLTDPNFLRTLENGIRYGNPILLENVEEVLDPALEPVLLKQFFKSGGQICIRLGTEDVPYSDEFQFFITTKMANPHYLPEICIKVTVINFTVTLKGLEDQLVVEVVANERPDLSSKRQELVVQIASDKNEMDRLEQLILKLLADAEGDVLSDDKLIITLDQSKKTGDECKSRMEVAENAMVEIDECTETLRPVATRASILYFVVADLGVIDPMYQYSLEFFVSLIKMRLRDSTPSDSIQERINILLEDFTRFMYINICRGLFEDHKLLFSFLITAQILRNQKHSEYIKKPYITSAEWLFFLRGLEAGKGLLPDDDYVLEDPPACIEKVPWSKLDTLERISNLENTTFKGLCAQVRDETSWHDFIHDNDLYEKPFPGTWKGKLNNFQELLVIKSLRENFLAYAIKNFVGRELGQLFIESPPFDLLGCFNDSQSTTPLIFILSSGADPTDYLLKLAKDKGYAERLHFISLGQGQGPKAERLINLGRESGDWVCLQNCHLATSWMGALERIQETQDPNQIDESYRLWLTSMPSLLFPVPVLQTGIKITNEPPRGVRANLMRSFAEIDVSAYESCTSKPREFKKLLFALAFFHAVILERRKFGPIGWNIPYEWMDSDFQVSREQVNMYLTSQPGVPWVTLNYIIAEVNYGGRVTDDKDVRLISAILARFFNEKVLDDTYTFSALKEYYAPPEGSLEACQQFSQALPMNEDPRVFGLHTNALITAQHSQAKSFLDTVMKVQPRISSGGGGKKPEDLVAEMAEEFLRRIQDLPKKKRAHAETYKATEEGGIISIGVFHGQEYDRFNELVSAVRGTLGTLGKAIKGLVVMSAAIEDMYNAFLTQKVPGNWIKVAYPCLKPLNSWVNDFCLRLEFMISWLLEGPPISFWIPVFFFPQGFMTASMQLHARKTKVPIDTLIFSTEMRDTNDHTTLTGAPESGVNIHGCYVQGCGWDFNTGVLDESEMLVLFVLMPVILLNPVLLAEAAEKTKGKYQCPLYKTSERKGTLSTTGHSTNFVMYLYLPTDQEDLGHWIRRGVALLLLLDD
jgi:dynein heavy chain